MLKLLAKAGFVPLLTGAILHAHAGISMVDTSYSVRRGDEWLIMMSHCHCSLYTCGPPRGL